MFCKQTNSTYTVPYDSTNVHIIYTKIQEQDNAERFHPQGWLLWHRFPVIPSLLLHTWSYKITTQPYMHEEHWKCMQTQWTFSVCLCLKSSICWCKAFWIKKQFSSGYSLSVHEASFQVRCTPLLLEQLHWDCTAHASIGHYAWDRVNHSERKSAFIATSSSCFHSK